MKIKSYEEAVRYLESFIGKIRFEITPEFLKHHDPLERMRVLLGLLDNPQDKFPSALIGGTSGKGSTAYLISHILTTADYKVGLTISPHLQKVNERLQVDNQSISDEGFLKLLNTSILSSIKEMSKMEVGEPSYFEILIAMAFLYFAKEKVDIAVVEVGMGGEYDATNTLYPLVAVLTNVSLDHTNILGGTVQKIARTKAGIIKFARGPVAPSSHPMSSSGFAGLRALDGMSTPVKQANSAFGLRSSSRATPRLIVATGVKQPSVIDIVESRCKEVGAELFRLDKDFEYRVKKESLEGSVFDLTTTHDRGLQLNNLNLSLLGRYQVENASLAIETVLQLEKFGFKVSEEDIRKALKTAFFPGRFEAVCFEGSPRPLNDSSSLNLKQSASVARANYSQQAPKEELFKSSFRGEARPRNYMLVLDGAHNPTKMRAFLSTLERLYPKNPKIFIAAFKNDKNIKGMLKQILHVADSIVVTEFSAKTDMSNRASAEASNIKYQISNIKKNQKVIVEKDSKKALERALNLSTAQQFNNSTIIVVTGSLYLVGEVRSML